MQKIVPILVVGILIISGIGAVAVSKETIDEGKINKITQNLNIDSSTLKIKESQEDFIEVEFQDTSAYLMNPGKPILPKIVETFELPFGVTDVNVEVSANNIKQVNNLATNLPDIIADSSQLQQVIINLVVNSIQAMPEGGKLTIKTFSENKYVYLIVEDTGLGISKENQSQIFLPFFTTKDVYSPFSGNLY